MARYNKFFQEVRENIATIASQRNWVPEQSWSMKGTSIFKSNTSSHGFI